MREDMLFILIGKAGGGAGKARRDFEDEWI